MTTTTAPAGYTAVFGDAGFNKYVGPVWQAPDGVVWLYYVVRYGDTWSSSRIW